MTEHWWENAVRVKWTIPSTTTSSYVAFVYDKSHTDWPDINPGLRGEKLTTSNLNYGTATTERQTQTNARQ